MEMYRKTGEGDTKMMWGWGAGMGWWMIFGGILFLIFWGVVIFFIVWGVRRFSSGPGTGGPVNRTPLDIAKERYAREEITKERYEQMKKDLLG
jgi:putative membrane protein